MYTVSYIKKRTYEKYDESHFLLYLNEQETEITKTSETLGEGEGSENQTSETVPGYSYTGTMPDGGTLVEVKEDSYGNFVSGLIRTRYPAADVEALQGNMIIAVSNPKNERAEDYKQDWDEFQSFRNDCKKGIKKLLGL
ncbi:hypothetical protein EZS27_033509 [termite gut metagenome]|uniref:Uncharacterized protein n=1 Tax=termite gut metagenome TaxID=433724 RepID=A0A5J4Q2J0_9ZZZZ